MGPHIVPQVVSIVVVLVGVTALGSLRAPLHNLLKKKDIQLGILSYPVTLPWGPVPFWLTVKIFMVQLWLCLNKVVKAGLPLPVYVSIRLAMALVLTWVTIAPSMLPSPLRLNNVLDISTPPRPNPKLSWGVAVPCCC